MPDLKMEMRLLNARHIASSTRGVADMIFSEPSFSVEHQQSGLSALLRASRSRCLLDRIRGSQHHVNGCDALRSRLRC